MADDFFIEYGDLIRDDGTFQDIDKHIDKLEKRLKDLAKSQKKAFEGVSHDDIESIEKLEKAANDLLKAEKELVKQRKVTNKVKKETIEITDEQLIQEEALKIAKRERRQKAKQEAIILKEEKNNIASLRAQLSLATLEWKKFTAEEIKNTKDGKKVFNDKKRLTAQLKKLEKATGDHRREVGNYSKSLGKLGKVATRVFVGRTIIDGLRAISNGVLNLIKENREADASIGELGDAFDETGSALKQAAVAVLRFFAPALTSIANGITKIIGLADKASKSIFGVGLGSKKASEGVRDLQTEFNAEIEVLKRGNISTEARKQLISDINKKYKDYLPNLLDENASLEAITRAQDAANVAFEKKITLLASEEQFIDLRKRSLDGLREEAALQRELAEAKEDAVAAERSGNVVGKTGINQAKVASDVRIQGINDRIKANKDLLAVIEEEKELLDEVIQSEGINTADFISNQKAKTEAAKTESIKRATNQGEGLEAAAAELLKESQDAETARAAAAEKRLKALEAAIKEVELLEADGIVDKTERLIRLEELRYKAEQELRWANHNELKALHKGQGEELSAIDDINNRKDEQQEIKHQENLAKIRSDAFDAEQKAFNDEVAATEKEMEDIARKEGDISDKKVKAAIEANKEREDSNKKLLKDVEENAKKVSAIVVDLFNKQSELAAQRVTDQETNLSRAEARAAQGLETNLASEKKALAERQLEQKKAAETAKNVAKAAALINLISSYAANGDKNALQSGLRDFALMQAAEAALGGFEEGGYTGEQGVSDIAGVVHGQEYVVTAKDTAKFGLKGKSGDDFGSAMGDYFNPQTPLTTNPYKAQKESFSKSVSKIESTAVLDELKGIKQQLAKQPNYSAQIVEVQKGLYQWVLREQKQNSAKIKKELIRAMKK